jgi:hypothetical protein
MVDRSIIEEFCTDLGPGIISSYLKLINESLFSGKITKEEFDDLMEDLVLIREIKESALSLEMRIQLDKIMIFLAETAIKVLTK